MGMEEVVIKTPAKINLFLYITSKKDNGYHEIESVFQTVSLYDVLYAYPSNKFSLHIKGEYSLPVDENNTIIKTKNLLEENGINVPPMDLFLVKNIPYGAGLGGGSSDAAGFIKLLKKLGVEINEDTERNILSMVGADCPFFIKGGAAIVKGIGDIIEPVELPEFSLILMKPPFEVSTSWAYKEFDKKSLTNINTSYKISFQDLISSLKYGEPLIRSVNDFERIIVDKYKSVQEMVNYLWELELPIVSLSGSGSALFAVVRNENDINRIREKVESYVGWRWWLLSSV